MKLIPRNHVVLAMVKTNKSSQKHGKKEKAIRRNDKVELKKTYFNRKISDNS